MPNTPQGARIEGIGTAGVPIGGVVTVQGIAAGTAQPVDTELPAAAATSDAMSSSPTVPGVNAFLAAVNRTSGNSERVTAGGGNAQPATGILDAILMLFNGATFDAARGDATAGLRVAPMPATAAPITVVGGANAIATATLPAPGAGLFHYITHISIRRVATAALAGGAILQATTTNLGGRSWRTGNVMSITVAQPDPTVLLDQEFVHPLKSDVANTVSTIVCPAAGAAVSWQIVVDYYVGP
jgi:hypothetical protein